MYFQTCQTVWKCISMRPVHYNHLTHNKQRVFDFSSYCLDSEPDIFQSLASLNYKIVPKETKSKCSFDSEKLPSK